MLSFGVLDMIKECVYCNKKFEATIKRQKYCSHLCNVKSYYKRHKHEIMKTREKYQKKNEKNLS